MRFSVVIPVYNRVEPLERALSSVLRQTCQDFEVYVVDDGSEADIAKQIRQLITELNDQRIQLLVHPSNKNGAAARNTGIRAARGDYICFLDSDDEWLPEKLQRVSEVLDTQVRSRLPILLHHQYQNVDNGIKRSALPKQAKSNAESVAHYSFVTNNVGGIQSSTITVSRELASQTLFNEKLKGHQDWDFCLRVGEVCENFEFISLPLALRYRDSDSGVAKSLDWRFSLNFLREYRCYFDPRTKNSYLQRVVIKKAAQQDELMRLFFILMCWPKIFFSISSQRTLIGSCLNRKRLKARYRRLLDYFNKNNVKRVILWGANNYTLHYFSMEDSSSEVICILDQCAPEHGVLFSSIPLRSVQSVEAKLLREAEAIVLMTDRHQQQMQRQLAERMPEACSKVLIF
ncbi:glycosyltransferase family 2 protein [Lacimicrobium alkaliphilum]|uniref:glycosyltransferase family 2 protein n=1 Tax=Lacimicrobium alkaliphilum TaxID=1526571 RepID=UPI000BFEB5CA|nr:glycosyltransferase family 2 protein [Lacimicrobium alkaliphilum]